MAVYVMNTIVLPIDFEKHNSVVVKIRKVDIEEVRRLLSDNEFISAIGHGATAALMSELLGINIPHNRITVKLRPGDIAVHFVLRERLPEGKVLSYEELRQLPFDLVVSEVLEA
jgi:hypothetical protein